MKKTFCDQCNTEIKMKEYISDSNSLHVSDEIGVVVFRSEKGTPCPEYCYPCTLIKIAKSMRLSHYINPPKKVLNE